MCGWWDHYGMYAGRRITEVDGHPTADLDAFIKAVSGKPDRASLRLKTVSWNGQTDVITLELEQPHHDGGRALRVRARQLDMPRCECRAFEGGEIHRILGLGFDDAERIQQALGGIALALVTQRRPARRQRLGVNN